MTIVHSRTCVTISSSYENYRFYVHDREQYRRTTDNNSIVIVALFWGKSTFDRSHTDWATRAWRRASEQRVSSHSRNPSFFLFFFSFFFLTLFKGQREFHAIDFHEIPENAITRIIVRAYRTPRTPTLSLSVILKRSLLRVASREFFRRRVSDPKIIFRRTMEFMTRPLFVAAHDT